MQTTELKIIVEDLVKLHERFEAECFKVTDETLVSTKDEANKVDLAISQIYEAMASVIGLITVQNIIQNTIKR